MICAGRFQVIVALAFINARAFSVEIACESGTCECAVTTFGSVFCMKTIHVSFSSVDLLHLLTHRRSTLLLYLYYKVIKAKTNDQAAILKNILKQIKYSQCWCEKAFAVLASLQTAFPLYNGLFCSLFVIHITRKTQLSATSAVWYELHNVLCVPMSIQPPFT